AASPAAPSEENFAAVMEALTATSPLPEIAKPATATPGATGLKTAASAGAAEMRPARKAGETTSGRVIDSPKPEPTPAAELAARAMAEPVDLAAATAAVAHAPAQEPLNPAASTEVSQAAKDAAPPETTAEVEPRPAQEPVEPAASPAESDAANA